MRGFTLIELLVVIAILSILAVATVLVLNPAELLKQGRDSSRLSDLAAIHSAIALYMVDVSSPSVGSGDPINCTVGTTDHDGSSCTTNATTTVDGNGWIPIAFTGISTGSPLPRLPIDPTNNSIYFYVYKAITASSTYELNANMESSRYAGGSSDVEATDGGNNNNVYEIGTAPGLNIP